MRALRGCALEQRQSALIFGDGPIGLLMLLLLLRPRESSRSSWSADAAPACLWPGEFGAAATLNYHEAGADLAAAVGRVARRPVPERRRGQRIARRRCFGKKASPERLGMRKATKKASATVFDPKK